MVVVAWCCLLVDVVGCFCLLSCDVVRGGCVGVCMFFVIVCLLCVCVCVV